MRGGAGTFPSIFALITSFIRRTLFSRDGQAFFSLSGQLTSIRLNDSADKTSLFTTPSPSPTETHANANKIHTEIGSVCSRRPSSLGPADMELLTIASPRDNPPLAINSSQSNFLRATSRIFRPKLQHFLSVECIRM